MTKAEKHTKVISKIRVTPKQREFVESVRADMEVEEACEVTLAAAFRKIIDMARGVA